MGVSDQPSRVLEISTIDGIRLSEWGLGCRVPFVTGRPQVSMGSTIRQLREPRHLVARLVGVRGWQIPQQDVADDGVGFPSICHF